MDRRRFLLTSLAGALAAPLGAGAQQAVSPRRVGVLLALLGPDSKEAQALRQGLRDAGYAEGRDVVIEWRSANGDYARLPQLAADLVKGKVDVIIADITVATQAAKHATSSIPIVMAIVADPVGSSARDSLSPSGKSRGRLTRESRFGGPDDRPPPGHAPRRARLPRATAARARAALAPTSPKTAKPDHPN
jgi:putative ABC transport system substrate-binding protein